MQKMEWKQSVMSPAASFLFHIGRLTSSALSCSHNIPTVITYIAGHFNCLLGLCAWLDLILLCLLFQAERASFV